MLQPTQPFIVLIISSHLVPKSYEVSDSHQKSMYSYQKDVTDLVKYVFKDLQSHPLFSWSYNPPLGAAQPGSWLNTYSLDN